MDPKINFEIIGTANSTVRLEVDDFGKDVLFDKNSISYLGIKISGAGTTIDFIGKNDSCLFWIEDSVTLNANGTISYQGFNLADLETVKIGEVSYKSIEGNWFQDFGDVKTVQSGTSQADYIKIGTFSAGELLIGSGDDVVRVERMTGGTITGDWSSSKDSIIVENMSNGTINTLSGENNIHITTMTGGNVVSGWDNSGDVIGIGNIFGGNIQTNGGNNTVEIKGFGTGYFQINGVTVTILSFTTTTIKDTFLNLLTVAF